MKNYIGIVFTLLFVNTAWSQTPVTGKHAIKFYNLTTFEEHSKSRRPQGNAFYHLEYTNKSLQVLHPTISLQWKTAKSDFHEIELSRFIISNNSATEELIYDSINLVQPISGGTVRTLSFALRYEYILNLNKIKDKKFIPSIGIGASPYYTQNDYTPATSAFYRTSEKYVGVRTFITPRINYFLSSKIFIDVNVPICFFELNYLNDKVYNPALLPEERAVAQTNYTLLPRIFSARLGLGIVI